MVVHIIDSTLHIQDEVQDDINHVDSNEVLPLVWDGNLVTVATVVADSIVDSVNDLCYVSGARCSSLRKINGI